MNIILILFLRSFDHQQLNDLCEWMAWKRQLCQGGMFFSTQKYNDDDVYVIVS